METNHIKFYKTRGWNSLDTLYAGNVITGDVFLFDNEDHEWRRSLFNLSQIASDSDFVEVEEFANGEISINDAIFNGVSASSLIYCYPSQFGDSQIRIRSQILGEVEEDSM